jgi:hypothetical protein
VPRLRIRWSVVVAAAVAAWTLMVVPLDAGPVSASPSTPQSAAAQYHAGFDYGRGSCIYLTVTRTPTFVRQVAGGGTVLGGNADIYGRLYINGAYAGRTPSSWNRNGTLVGFVFSHAVPIRTGQPSSCPSQRSAALVTSAQLRPSPFPEPVCSG